MNALFEAAAELQALCDRQGWLTCVTGGSWYIEDQLSPLAALKEEPAILDALARPRGF